MKCVLHTQWTEYHEDEYDSVDDAIEAGRAVLDAHPDAGIWFNGEDFQGSVFVPKPSPLEAALAE